MSSNAQRFGEVVRTRREQLEMNQLEVGRAGGPSNTMLTAIENGLLSNLSPIMAKRLDAGLSWKVGSARAVWNGGDAQPLEEQIPSGVLSDLKNVSPSTRAYILRRLGAEETYPPSTERGESA